MLPPLRASAAEQAVAGGPAGRVAPAAELAADGTSPPSDLNAGPDYRQQLAWVLTGRALGRAARA